MVTNGKNGLNGSCSKKRELTAQKLIEAIHASHGLLTLAAKRAGIGFTTAKRYVAEFSSVAQAVVDSKEHMLDFAEAKLFQKIDKGDNACLIFYLKCQGKERGYIEHHEFSGPGGGPIPVDTDPKDRLSRAITSLAARIGQAQSDKQPDQNGS